MVHIQQFDSTEDMVEFLRKNRQAVMERLHDAQRALAWGDHWVQFVPTGDGDMLTVWGKVHTREEVASAELGSGAMTWEETVNVLTHTEQQQEEGLLYGRAYDRHNPMGELGHTHKASVWPIEKRLFDAANEAHFNHTLIADEAMRLLLEIAYRSFRAHAMSQS